MYIVLTLYYIPTIHGHVFLMCTVLLIGNGVLLIKEFNHGATCFEDAFQSSQLGMAKAFKTVIALFQEHASSCCLLRLSMTFSGNNNDPVLAEIGAPKAT